MGWALVLHHNAEFAEVVTGFVSQQAKDAEIATARNLADARRELRRRGEASCRVIVAGIRLPRTPSDALALDGEELTTLELVQEIRAGGNDELPIVLLAAYTDSNRMLSVTKLAKVEVVAAGEALPRSLPPALRRALALDAQDPSPLSCVDLDIRLHKEPPYYWQISSKTSPPIEAAGALQIDRGDFDELRGLMPDVVPERKFLAAFGSRLYKVVMTANADERGNRLRDLLLRHCDQRGGFESARIRFSVDDYTHPVLLEAVADPASNDRDAKFWMLEAPIFRKYNRNGERFPLFKDDASCKEPLDCLIIQGELDDFFAGGALQRPFRKIPSAGEEVSWLEQFLEANRRRFGIGSVRVLRHSDGGAGTEGTFAARIKDALRERTWRLVHYAGHSARAGNDRGYLVTGGGDDDLIDAEWFGAWASKAQFVFLSSCDSADSYFVLRLVDRHVPAVLGYRWEIDDLTAREFAKGFYGHLLEAPAAKRHLEYAFLNAKRDLHGRTNGSRAVWAAPMLIMQMMHAEAA
jgi:hypothetical protein